MTTAIIRRNADGQQNITDLRKALAETKHMVYSQGGTWVVQQWSYMQRVFFESPMHPSCGERQAIQKCLFGSYETADEAAIHARR
jgi:hypothetical protein